MEKPNRTLLGRMGGYAEEASAYLRRRRINRRPFARVYYPGGQSTSFDSGTDAGRALFRTAADLIDAAR